MTKLTAAELARQTLERVQSGNSANWIDLLLVEDARNLADLLAQLNADPDPRRHRVGELLTRADARRRNGVKP